MGLANKIAYKFATKMYSTFEQAAGLAKVEHVGAVTKVSDQNTPEPDELVDIQTHFDPKLANCIVCRWFCRSSCL
ncbi:transferase [Streptococcus oralis]|nr:transferase [Streptococcus oralis]